MGRTVALSLLCPLLLGTGLGDTGKDSSAWSTPTPSQRRALLPCLGKTDFSITLTTGGWGQPETHLIYCHGERPGAASGQL